METKWSNVYQLCIFHLPPSYTQSNIAYLTFLYDFKKQPVVRQKT